jgi:GNAT superfamily N-acetyltransferase
MERYEITTSQEKRRVGPLFDGIDDSLIKTFLQGYAGTAYCDDLAFPRCATIEVNDYLFFGGDPHSENAAEFAAYAPEGHAGLNIVACDEGWIPLIESAHPGKTQTTIRYATWQTLKNFDKDNLRQIMRTIPQGYTLLGMDDEIYELAMAQEWSRDFCSFFSNAEDYIERGIGFCVLHGDDLVSGASSFSIYDEGIEVQVATREDHQRKGLAKACSAALVLACLSQGRMPCWDAANKTSLHLAEELGYKFKREYKCIYLAP